MAEELKLTQMQQCVLYCMAHITQGRANVTCTREALNEECNRVLGLTVREYFQYVNEAGDLVAKHNPGLVPK
jgi:hypothetical protein